MLLVALVLLTGAFKYIPKATLAGVIIVAMYYLCEFEAIPIMWRTKRKLIIPKNDKKQLFRLVDHQDWT